MNVTSTISTLAQTELDYSSGRVVLDIISNVFNLSMRHDSEALDTSTSLEAMQTLSKVMEDTVSNDTLISDVEKISNTIRNIGRLSMIDKPSGEKIFISSNNIHYAQHRELVENVFGKNFTSNTGSASVIFHPGTFDFVETQQIYSVDVQLILWNRKVRNISDTTSNILSDVVSVTLVDDSGKDIIIEKVGKDPIDIKIYSPHVIHSSLCKYFNIIENQWKEVSVKEREIGKWIICATTHLTDFATFDPNAPQLDWDRNFLWFIDIPCDWCFDCCNFLSTTFSKEKERTIAKKKSDG